METIPLDAVIANEELERRQPRRELGAATQAAIDTLARALATSPRQVLQKLTDTVLELCQADSAGVSLVELEGERQVFRWHAVAGKFAPLRMPGSTSTWSSPPTRRS